MEHVNNNRKLQLFNNNSSTISDSVSQPHYRNEPIKFVTQHFLAT